MKKLLLALTVLFTGTLLSAAETGDNYELFTFSIWDGLPESQMLIPTYGVKLGILGSGGAPVYGVEGAVINAGTPEMTGFKGALAYTTGNRMDGVILAPVNCVTNFKGLALAVVNYAKTGGIQIGILNFLEDGFLPWFPIVNFSCK